MASSVPASQQTGDCSSPILLSLIWLWIMLVTLGRIGAGIVESAFVGMFSSSFMALQVVIQVVLIALPLALLARSWRNPHYRSIYQVWSIASLFPLFLLPVQFIPETEMQLQDVLQIVLSLIFAFIIYRVSKPAPYPLSPISSWDEGIGDRGYALPIAFLVAGIFAWPWFAWGAPGSALDIFLSLLTALAFGLAAGATLIRLRSAMSESPGHFFFYSFGSGMTLYLLASGLGFSFDVMQALLMVSLASLGGVVVGLLFTSIENHQARGPLLPLALLIGLCAAAPIILIDPDELAIIISDTLGEILFWAIRAALVSFVIGFIASTVAALRYRRRTVFMERAEPTRSRGSSLPVWGAILAWIVAAGIFVSIGRPGFYGEGLFVILKDQVDVKSLTANQPDPAARRSLIYQTLVKQANQTQAPLRQALDRFHIAYTPYYLENAIQVQGGPLVRWWLERQPQVDRVLDNPWLRPLPEPLPVNTGDSPTPTSTLWNQILIGADRVWNELHVTGKGVIVGQSDSGVQWDHPQLKDSYRGWNATTGQLDNNYNWYDPWYNTSTPRDIGGHGTHTLGTAVGNQVGIAPDATWYACVNLARNLGNPSLYLDCMQFMLAPFPLKGNPFTDGDPSRGANVINDSWGCPSMEGCDPNALKEAVDALRAAGIFVVASAGNDGPSCDTIKDPPALYAASVSVGAIDSSGNLAFFSSLGPVTADGSDRIKPDLVAPGVDVLSSMPGNTYGTESGTSMSGPHVVGVVALMWSANPGLIGNIDQTEQILLQATQPYKGPLPNCPEANAHPSTAVGYGIVDAYQAVKLAMQVK